MYSLALLPPSAGISCALMTPIIPSALQRRELRYMKLRLWLLWCLVMLAACSTPNRIFLDNYSRYDFDTVHTSKDGLHHFLNYRLLQSDIVQMNDSLETALVGLIAPGLHVYHHDRQNKARLSSGTDTCLITYHSDAEVTRSGRSAIVSIYNLFANEKNRISQRPYRYVSANKVEGHIQLDSLTVPFSFLQVHRDTRYEYEGFLALQPDSIFVAPANKALTPRNKIVTQPMGIYLLQNSNRQVFAALDFEHKPGQVYLLRQLTEKDKLLVAAFLSTIYNQHLGTALWIQYEDDYY